MFKRFKGQGATMPYLIFSLTDETFALLSSLPETPDSVEERRLFMLYVSVLDQFYWVAGSVIGALAGTFIPFDMKGIGFALTALFVVLMIEQIKRIKKPGVFVVSAAAALLGVFLLPGKISLLAAMALALGMALLLTVFIKRMT
jgi:4-azaleucine resistance transporter AzlC